MLKKTSIVYTISLLFVGLLMVATPAFGETLDCSDAEVYFADSTYKPASIEPFERGYCTDSYSKEWCDAHGFANNRPVPHSVPLNSKEKKCLNDFYISVAGDILIAGVTLNAGVFVGTPVAAFTLWNCLA